MKRAVAVVCAALLQIVAGAVGGIGLWGEPVGEVANSYPTLLLPGGGAFGIWSLIYVTFTALAIRQVLPSQRTRVVHQRTGWWLVAAGVLNAAWIALFSHRLITLAQIVIIGLLVCL
ncbi:MAG: tryptophan-rich sensory protein, partial [Kibdelosporangium sp.]